MKRVIFLLACALSLLVLWLPMNPINPDLHSLQTLAVQDQGRKKPLDTVALETVTSIHGSDHFRQSDGEDLDYLQTYLALAFNDRDWNQEPLILFNYRPLKKAVGLDPEQKYFSFQELMQSQVGTVAQAAHRHQSQDLELTRQEREALILEDRLARMLEIVGRDSLSLIPHSEDIKGRWLTWKAATSTYEPEVIAPLLAQYEILKRGYALGSLHWSMVNTVADQLHQGLRDLSPEVYPSDQVLEREVRYQALHPFARAWILYAIATVIMLISLGWKQSALYWGSLGIFTSGIGLHLYGIILRMQIAGRPPVTNMYESVIWVGLGTCAVALIFELITRARYYLLAAAPISVALLLLADNLPAVLDASIQPLVPVLRDNFWLSIHVPTITLSYACFALAMGLGHILLGHYLLAPGASQRIQKLGRLNYAVLQLGVLLLATGIILGGIWAHFSWGRFWGWDPKETWAAIALLCYLVPLHGRFVGWIGSFGMAVVSVISFNAVLMAWYGVNFVLGQGLHSYGFGSGGAAWVALGVGIDLLFVLIVALRYSQRQISTSLEAEGRTSLSQQPI
ncbi:MAG: cytochrome c biogenesis protein CcsA [Synechococcaceae cyanobacterium SM2_3_1]|nr:cytochrome c biogenesis protein CcsA [Synechococcaceae cyanobacterium SM2_3_1]